MGDLIDFTLSNARRFYSSEGKNLAAKGLKTMSRKNPQKSPKRRSERPGDLMKNLETPGKTVELAGVVR